MSRGCNELGHVGPEGLLHTKFCAIALSNFKFVFKYKHLADRALHGS